MTPESVENRPVPLRFLRFNTVGVLGIGVQLLVVDALVHGVGVDPVLATGAGVSAAVVHNFGWHVRWTWRDRIGPGVSRLAAFARFAGANGVVSVVGSMLLMPVLMAAGLPAIPANLVTIAACGLVNYWLADGIFGQDRLSLSVSSLQKSVVPRSRLSAAPRPGSSAARA
jgi:putative flippase GtrA